MPLSSIYSEVDVVQLPKVEDEGTLNRKEIISAHIHQQKKQKWNGWYIKYTEQVLLAHPFALFKMLQQKK